MAVLAAARSELATVLVRLPDGGSELRSAVELPSCFDHLIESWDMAFKDTRNSDFVADRSRRRTGRIVTCWIRFAIAWTFPERYWLFDASAANGRKLT